MHNYMSRHVQKHGRREGRRAAPSRSPAEEYLHIWGLPHNISFQPPTFNEDKLALSTEPSPGITTSIVTRDSDMKLPASLLVLTITTPALGFLSWLKTEEAPAYTPCDNSCSSEPKCCSAVLEDVLPDECFLRTSLGLCLPVSLYFVSPFFTSTFPLAFSPVPRPFFGLSLT